MAESVEGVVSGIEHHPTIETTKLNLGRTLVYLPYRIELPLGTTVRVPGEWRSSPRIGDYFRGGSLQVVDEPQPEPRKRRRGAKERPLAARVFGRREVDAETQKRVEVLAPILDYLLSTGGRAKARRLVLKTRDPRAVRRNPFKLYLSGVVDWQTASEIADRLLVAPDAPERIDATIRESVEQAYAGGRSCLDLAEVCRQVGEWLKVGIAEGQVKTAKTVVTDVAGRCWLPRTWNLRRLTLAQLARNTIVGSPATDDDTLFDLTGHRYMLLTGSAGAGKTTALRRVRAVYEDHGFGVVMTATTGKAASVLSEDAQTIHRVLGFGRGGFAVKELAADVLIVDEASMLDWSTAWAIFRAAQGRVVLCGDPSQLPPVEGGSVMRELMDVLPVVALEKIHRFAGGGAPNITTITRASVWGALSTALTLAVQAHRRGEECQVLAPIKGLPIGTFNLNLALQSKLNPSGERHGKFRLGDRVIMTRNLPGRAWNGQIGTLRGIDGGGRFLVDLPGGRTADVWDTDIDLAYCLTVHKAQGSQFARVILVLPEREHLSEFMTTELLHTATTRAVEGTTVITVRGDVANDSRGKESGGV